MKYFSLDDYIELYRNNGMLCHADPGAAGHEPVKLLTYDSRKVIPGTLFICKGAAFKEEYLKQAIEKGAFAYLADQTYETGTEIAGIIVKDIRTAMPPAAEMFYNYAWKDLKITGFGGTKGKSTSAYYMKAIVDDYMEHIGGKESAVLSSIDNYDGVIREESHITTAESVELHEHLHNAVKSGITYLEMEVSSQALKYNRVDNMRLDIGVFMNISEDHISPIEHADFEDYLTSKMKMFRICDNTVVNLDADPAYIGRILEAAKDAGRVFTFGQHDMDADFYVHDVHKQNGNIFFRVRRKEGLEENRENCTKNNIWYDEEFILTMPGLFNVENAAAAIACACIYDIPLSCIKSGIKRARSSGRMELYTSEDGKVTAIVDYAHNKLSFEKLFGSTREEYPDHDIIAIFGCPGYKATQRRKDLGEISGRYSKKVYLVAEDPGKEPVEQISAEIAQYVAAQGCPYEMIEDRGEAIGKAILECKKPTVILITGKGNETRQKYGTEYLDCPSDVAYVKKYIKAYDSGLSG